MADMAAEHADAIRALGSGPVDVAGISTGGSIAQQLAADHPDVVARLLLLCTACRLGPQGRRLQRRVAARIRARRAPAGAGRDDGGARAARARPGRRRRARRGSPVRALLAAGDDLADMATTIEAEDAFDLAACARPIRAPTVIVAGSEDRFYAPELFAETAELIPGSRLRRARGSRPRHGRAGSRLDARDRALRRGGG